MLSDQSKRELGPGDVDRIVREERAELAAQAKAITDEHAAVRAIATVRYPDGEMVTLELEDGRFRISSADGLPTGGRSPEQALEQFRKALARRSYPALLRVLSPSTQRAIEADLRAIVTGLVRPDALDVQVNGDSATVRIEGGHLVKLRRDGGFWRVEDFD
jgi:hypothetical protein